jgi:hypothetical protein
MMRRAGDRAVSVGQTALSFPARHLVDWTLASNTITWVLPVAHLLA